MSSLKKKFLPWLLSISFVLFSASLFGGGKEIFTSGEGSGTTEQEALHAAMKDSVRKAVGVYVTTKSELKDQDFKDQIIMASDATITKYKVVKR